ncbi:MAG: helicase [Actinobacteria bacterium]|nr:helicase [Actinomycetota bacterium]
MNKQFITNQKQFLSEVINNILPSSEKVYFLIGYFYFSGFKELYKNLKDKNIDILIGLDIEKGFLNKFKEFEIIAEIESYKSKKDIRLSYYKNFVEFFNHTDYFDSLEKQEAFKVFMGKLKDGSLRIKKTLKPNHAKLYLFANKAEHSQGGLFPGTIITGSSNLTESGLKNQFEINVILRDPSSYSEAQNIFDQVWSTAVDIVSKDNLDEFLNEVVENIWINKTPKPFLLFLRVLYEYFTFKEKESIKLPAEITKERFLNLKYQIDAIQQSLDIIQKHTGVIISDVVGLGKSIIASAVAHNFRLKTIIICPPHLKDQWDNDYRFNFDFNAKVYGSGSIEKALIENNDSEEKLIIVDEAHKYRNEVTQDYANLHKLCQGNKVILLTATPFNNLPEDIFSMIKLFQIPTLSTIQTENNLSNAFREIVKEYKAIKKAQKEKSEEEKVIKQRLKIVAAKIRDLIAPVVIRRSRLDLMAIEEYRKDLEIQNIRFPKVKVPKLLEYDLGNLSDLYIGTLLKIAPEDKKEGFIGARYKPIAYLKDKEKYRKTIEDEFGDLNLFRQSQINLADFMKRLLVHRFESSIEAFRKSLDSMIESAVVIKDWYERLGKVPIYKRGKLPDVNTLLESTNDYLEDELKEINLDDLLKEYKEKGLEIINVKEIKKSFIEDVKKDIRLLQGIQEEWFGNNSFEDKKLKAFKKIIKDQLKNDSERKIIVFSEYADTAEYLHRKLQTELKAFLYTSKLSTAQNKKIIKDNFDAGSLTPSQDYDILIATDAISEGYNLHRAGTVFNYDIPYNPTRVIQRVGRINRINKKVFDELFIYNFFPTSTGEKETRIKQISTLKITMINHILGEDTKVLTSEEELNSFYKEQFIKELAEQEEKSWDVEYLNLLNGIKSGRKEILEEALKIPLRTRIRRTVRKDKSGVLVFGKKGSEYTFKFGKSPEESISLTAEEALKLFEADFHEKVEPVSGGFENIYQSLKKNLFRAKTEFQKDKGVLEAIKKLEILIDMFPSKKSYLEDLLYVLEELDNLPERFAKLIRAVNSNTIENDLKILQKEVPHEYLLSIINKANAINKGEECLILSEELI